VGGVAHHVANPRNPRSRQDDPMSVQTDIPAKSGSGSDSANGWRAGWIRAVREFTLLGRDPIIAVGLSVVFIFVFLFIAMPLLSIIRQGFVNPATGQVDLQYFQRFIDPTYATHLWQTVRNTLVLGIGAATGGTIVGFIFAYALVRCTPPFSRAVHYVTLLPSISPPFAIAIATILLFGRNGLVTRQWLGIRPGPGSNDIYGLDGLIFVQIITFFPVAYLILRGLLERIDASMEEAALSLGASKFHIFRTVTLPLLMPGIAASFLLLFVESVADLGNPLLLGGSASVLSTEIYLSVAGQHDQAKAAALSLVLLIPTLIVFLVQYYYLRGRSYISVTGKPTTGRIFVKEPVTRWVFNILTFSVLALVLVLYFSIVAGSFTRLWGINNEIVLNNYQAAFSRGLNAMLSTTFLSAVATPIAAGVGMIIAFLVVRRNFAGKQALDFTANLGGAVPGTILGIGYIIAFIQAPTFAVVVCYALLGLVLFGRIVTKWWLSVILLLAASFVGYYFNWLPYLLGLDEDGWRWLIAAIFAALAVIGWFATVPERRRTVALIFGAMALALTIYNLSPLVLEPIARWGRTLPGVNLPKVVARFVTFFEMLLRPTMAIYGYTFLTLSIFAVQAISGRMRYLVGFVAVALCAALIFYGQSLALVGTPYILLAAFAVRSLPASVRAGVASLQQIDPSIEEASTILGGDAQHTFRRVTLPLILPALFAGMVFAFARHMTSLSAVIFLTTARWPILTVWILSEVEQGGMSVAAAYSVILIAIVLLAIGLMSWWLRKTYGSSQMDMNMGSG
jgi:iron(III) transport system permease protein